MPNETETPGAGGAASARTGWTRTPAEVAGAETMNRLIRRPPTTQPGPAAWRQGSSGEGGTGEQPETVAARMRARAEEIDAQLGQGTFPEASERAFWRGYAQAMDDWAEAAETGTADR